MYPRYFVEFDSLCNVFTQLDLRFKYEKLNPASGLSFLLPLIKVGKRWKGIFKFSTIPAHKAKVWLNAVNHCLEFFLLVRLGSSQVQNYRKCLGLAACRLIQNYR